MIIIAIFSEFHGIQTTKNILYYVRFRRLSLCCWRITTAPVTKMTHMPTTVGVGRSRRHCYTGYDRSRGRRPSTLKCIGSFIRRRYNRSPSIPSEINPKPDIRVEKATAALGGTTIPGKPVSDGDRGRSLPEVPIRLFLFICQVQ